MIWAKVARYLPAPLPYDTWWKLVKLYATRLLDILDDVLWCYVAVPVHKGQAQYYLRLAEIDAVGFEQPGYPPSGMVTEDGGEIGFYGKDLVFRFAELRLDNGHLRLHLAPTAPGESSSQPPSPVYGIFTHTVSFERELKLLLCAWSGGTTLVNREHPLPVASGRQEQVKLGEFMWALSHARLFTPTGQFKYFELKYRREAGLRYTSIKWDKMDPALGPPYKMFSELEVRSELTDEELRSWAQIKVPQEDV